MEKGDGKNEHDFICEKRIISDISNDRKKDITDSNVDIYDYVNEYYNREKEYFNFNLHDTGYIVENFYIDYFISYSTGNVIQLPHQYLDPIIVRNSGYTISVYQQQYA